MSMTAIWSDAVEYDPATGSYFDPLTFSDLDWEEGLARVQAAHAAGEMVYGVDNTDPAGGGADLTLADNQANLNAAAAQAANAVGLDPAMRSTWTIYDRGRYLDAFRAIVLANPGMFTDQTVQTAARINSASLTDVSAGADFGIWITDALAPVLQIAQTPANVANQLLEALSNVGRGLSAAGSLSQLAIPIAFVAFLYFAVQSVGRDPGGQSRKLISAFA